MIQTPTPGLVILLIVTINDVILLEYGVNDFVTAGTVKPVYNDHHWTFR